MTEVKTDSGDAIRYYSSAKEMPSGRFTQFQKYLFESWGVGSTMQDVDLRMANAFQLVAADSKDKALQELYNLRLTINYVIEKLSINSYAFAILISEYNGEMQTDFSESALSNLIDRFKNDLSQERIEAIVEDVKKKLRHN